MKLVSHPAGALTGTVRVPGDKSISHRALMLGGLAVGRTRVEGLLEGEDVLATARAMAALGAGVERLGDGRWQVDGVGVGGLAEPEDVLDLGNAGTAARLLAGVLAGHDLTAFLTGDSSLRRRPMARVMRPLEEIGARFVARAGGRLPMAVIGSADPMPIDYRLPVASAQVKSAVLFAGLCAPGVTMVRESAPTRDHTELMLRHFGATVRTEADGTGHVVALDGQPTLRAADVRVPSDPSSAAFPLVAALLRPDGRVTLDGVGLNPTRTGLLDCLAEMGASVSVVGRDTWAGEPVGSLVVEGGRLVGIDVPAERAPRMIDEYPVLAVAAAFAEGTTRFRGVGELRVKESDRLTAIADGLAACGVAVELGEDELAITGSGRPPAGGATIASHLDHRIAMAFLVMGLATEAPVAIDDAGPIETSFPGFVALMNGLGADIRGGDDGAGAA